MFQDTPALGKNETLFVADVARDEVAERAVMMSGHFCKFERNWLTMLVEKAKWM